MESDEEAIHKSTAAFCVFILAICIEVRDPWLYDYGVLVVVFFLD
jgi:hypothetical protein